MRKKRMWMVFVAGAVLSWGAYGAMLALGQSQLGNPLKALLCVGAAYFLIGVIVPVFALGSQGGLSNFNSTGLVNATIAGAPIVNVVVAMLIRPPQSSINPMMYAGFVLVSIGAWMVLYFRPTA